MIARIWSARTSGADNANAYQNLFPTDALDHLRKLAGFQGAYLLRRDRDTGAEFVAVTLFESLDAVRAFAGDAYEEANVSQPAREVLDDIDERVCHFTVVVADAVPVSAPS